MAFDPKVCEVCGRKWAPKTRYQAARNRTCSRACAGRMVSAAKAGKATGNRAKRVTLTCPECGKKFERRERALLSGSTEPTCSRKCNGARRGRQWATHAHKGRAAWTDASRASYAAKMTGPLNPAWKGGAMIRRSHGNHKGARYVRCPPWARPMARADGYIMEHRLLMAEMTGYLLMRTEVVHHRNHDSLDNAGLNLELWPTNAAHKMAEHGRLAEGAACRTSLVASVPR